MPLLLGPEAGPPRRQLASRMLQAARILRCQGFPRRGGLCVYFETFSVRYLFIFLLFQLDHLLTSFSDLWEFGQKWWGLYDKVEEMAIEGELWSGFFIQTSDLFVFVVSNYAFLPRPGRLWNTRLDSQNFSREHTSDKLHASRILLFDEIADPGEGRPCRDVFSRVGCAATAKGFQSRVKLWRRQNTQPRECFQRGLGNGLKVKNPNRRPFFDLKSQSSPTTWMWILYPFLPTLFIKIAP